MGDFNPAPCLALAIVRIGHVQPARLFRPWGPLAPTPTIGQATPLEGPSGA